MELTAQTSPSASSLSPHRHDEVILGEGVTVEAPVAAAAIRSLSALIDVVVYSGLTGLLLTAANHAFGEVNLAVQQGISSLILVLVWLVFPWIFEVSTRGRSLGKLITRTRVVRTDLGPISPRHSLVRCLLRLVEISLGFGIPSLISLLVTRKTQRLGDLAAGTIVVNDNVPLILSTSPQMPPQLAGWAMSADLGTIPMELSLAIRQFLSRRERIAGSARQHMAADLAARLAPYVLPAPPAGTTEEDFLTAVLAERGRRERFRMERQRQLVGNVLGQSGPPQALSTPPQGYADPRW